MTNDDAGTVTIHRGAADWHGGEGWYWMHDEYPEDSGYVGSFETAFLAAEHAEKCGYVVSMRRSK